MNGLEVTDVKVWPIPKEKLRENSKIRANKTRINPTNKIDSYNVVTGGLCIIIIRIITP